MTGAGTAASFPPSDRVKLVRLPQVKKLVCGGYVSVDPTMSLGETIRVRQALIQAEASEFAPHLVIVDKEPSGLLGELLPALGYLKHAGSQIVLGLRDILDAPERLREEWNRKQAAQFIERFYDEIWIYGPQQFYDPLAGLDLPAAVRNRTSFMGFLARSASKGRTQQRLGSDYLVVTAGGGADGYPLIARAIEAFRELDGPEALIVAGPYMAPGELSDLSERARGSAKLEVVAFDPCMEDLIAGCQGLISMCGYNTFCEALSFDVPALYVPRTVPRREQWIRASRSQALGWSTLLPAEELAVRGRLVSAIKRLVDQEYPSLSKARPDMAGLDSIVSRVMLSQLQSSLRRAPYRVP